MRTTVRFDDDVAAAVRALRAEESIGVNEAVNALIRRGLTVRPTDRRTRYRPRSRDMGMLIDVANVQEALDLADGHPRR